MKERATPATDERVAQLYRQFGPVIYARCRRFLKDNVASEDATQEIFLKLLSNIGSLDNDKSVLHWVYRSSNNHCLNLLRHQRYQEEPVAELPEIFAEDMEQAIIDRNFAMRLISISPDHLRETVALYYLDGLTQEEVADVLQVTRRTIVNRLQDFHQHAQQFRLQPHLEAVDE